MNRIDELFTRKPKNVFSVYFTAGYPQLNDTVPIIKELVHQGVDIIEIGVPFSDPMSDGAVIRTSTHAALKNGMKIDRLFDDLASIRAEVSIPLVMMSYVNPILCYGFERFCQRCEAVGIDGLIIPDLPFKDYLTSYKEIAAKHNLYFSMLITPETSEERIREIDAHTDGFIYMVSSASITGAQTSFDAKKQDYFKRISNMKLSKPRLIGFGISNAETLEAARAHANGTIIGSKFIQLLGTNNTIQEAVTALMHAVKRN